ncbi:hypothetical protein BFJ68_g15990 [Fusarium oxysporum]|uniref:Azaphilone pigments biosynthesis cluster protein L N-terminal domain-containing protein n=1 Tax=Fusarium oxysporum TaxID=5507 RepID=A0A420PI13_FUSOX|nr:hypothetical protein BFJ68_g15990 [Fusarium oxysporum]
MDPLSITSACVALLGAVTKTTLAVTNFTRDCRDARSDLTSITGELSQLHLVLELLKDDTAVTDDRIIPESLQKQILSIIDNCSAVVSKINSILDNHAGKAGVLKWVTFGKTEVVGLRMSLEAHRGSLNLVLELVSVSLSKAIRNDTTAIRTDVHDIKQDTSQIPQIMDELTRLRAIVAAGEIPSATSGQNFILQQYLDGLTSYAESVCKEVVWETDSSVRAVSRSSSRSSLRNASSAPVTQLDRNADASSQAVAIPDTILENEGRATILELARSVAAGGETSLSAESGSPDKHVPKSLKNRDSDPIKLSDNHKQPLHSKLSASALQPDKLPGIESHTSSQGHAGCELPPIKSRSTTQQIDKPPIDVNTFSNQACEYNESNPKPTLQIKNPTQLVDKLSTEEGSQSVLVPNDSGSEFGEEHSGTASASTPIMSIGLLTSDASAEAHPQSPDITSPCLTDKTVLRDTDITTNTNQTADVNSTEEYDPYRFVPDLRIRNSTPTKVYFLSHDSSSFNIQKQEHLDMDSSIPQRPISMSGRLFFSFLRNC